MLVAFAFLKLAASTVTVYLPGSTNGKRKAPCSSVVAVRCALVASLVSVTVAPDTVALLGSVTVPLRLPCVELVVWAAAVIATRQITKALSRPHVSLKLILLMFAPLDL